MDGPRVTASRRTCRQDRHAQQSEGPQSVERIAKFKSRPPARVGVWLTVGNLVIASLLVAATVATLRNGREVDVARAGDAAANLASSLGIELGAELRLVDNTLATLAGRMRQHPASADDAPSPALRAEVAEQQRLLPFVSALGFVGGDGRAVEGGGLQAGPLSDDERGFLLRAAQSPGVSFSEPLVMRRSGEWGLLVARAVGGADAGQPPRGTVYAALSSQHFARLFAGFAVGEGGAISLRTDAGRLVARHSAADPGSTKGLGSDTMSAELRSALSSRADAGTYTTVTALDGIERVNAFRRVPGFPFVVLAGLGTEQYLAPWTSESLWHWGVTVGVLVLVLLGSLYVHGQHRRVHEALLYAAELATQQDAMLNNDVVGMLKLRDRRVVWSNLASERMFGYSHAEMLGMSARDVYPSTSAYEEFGRTAYEALEREGRYRAQLPLVRRDGSPIWVDVSGRWLSRERRELLWMSLDITAMRDQHEQVRHAALHDALTGLPNRLLLMDRLGQAVQVCHRTDQTLAVCFIDLDGFKLVNDHHGHAAGDRLLQCIAQRLQLALRARDTVARVGGDEFVMLLPELRSREEAQEIVDRLVAAVAPPVELPDGAVAAVRASVGIAVWPDDGRSEESLLAAADRAMYADKSAGRAATALR